MAGYQIASIFVVVCIGLTSAQTRIWTLAIGHEWGAHEYFDSSGYLKGFGYDIVGAVCKEGGMDCRMVWDKYSNCWQSNPGDHPSGGRGLMGRWYDGCMGWVASVERIHTLGFTYPYLEETTSYFYFKKGARFDESNLSSKNIAFLDGWASNEKCLARQTGIRNSVLSKSQIMVVPNPQDAIDLLDKGQAQAMFGAEDNWTPDQRKLLDRGSGTYHCFLGGNGVIARKDSALIPAWNVGFSKIKDSNKYSKLCKEFNEKHKAKGVVQCYNV